MKKEGLIKTDCCFLQIRLSRVFYLKIKSYCIKNDIKLFEFYENVITQFLEKVEKRELEPIYRVAQDKECRLTIRLSYQAGNRLKECSKRVKVSSARIFFTALVLYLDTL
jgi:hypothetical protein